jgi:hypothetical protein
MVKLFQLGLLLIILTSCGVSTSYVGKTYPPTNEVDLYLDWRDVSPAYEVMGYIDATPSELNPKIEEAQKKIEQLAREKGADGIVIEGIEERTVTNPTSSTKEEATKNANGGYTKTSTTTINEGRARVLKATFIKYK